MRGGVDSIEHGIFMTDECVREMVERGTWLVPTLAALVNILDGAKKPGAGIPAYVTEKAERIAGRHVNSVKIFYAAGGRIAMGTDAGTPFNRHGDNARELEFMADIGVGARDAIFFATASAADLMRLSDHGRLKEGHQADLLLVDGDPLSDVRRVSRKEHHGLVVKRGQVAHDNRAAVSSLRIAAQ